MHVTFPFRPNITAGQLQNLDISDSIFLRAAEIYKEPNINYVFDSMENTGMYNYQMIYFLLVDSKHLKNHTLLLIASSRQVVTKKIFCRKQ